MSISEVTQSATVLETSELNYIKSSTVAGSLSQLPGINQTFYGPNANRPIIRGLGGYRINVLENGLSTFDLSASSNDHAVAINPILIDRIEILRGSAALIHGSNSIGGIVNTYNNEIPNLFSGKKYDNKLNIKLSSVDNGENIAGIIYQREGNFIFQVNSSSLKTDNYKVPSFFPSHEEHHHNHTPFYSSATEVIPVGGSYTGSYSEGEYTLADDDDDDHGDVPLNEVENTYSDIDTIGFGGSYNFDKGYIGASFSSYDSEYGVPNHEDSVVTIEREKLSLQGLYEFDSGYFDRVNFELARGDYSHSEESGHGHSETPYEKIENNGSITFEPHEHDNHHALFLYQGIDSKAIFTRKEDLSSSALSISYTDFDMKITGEESYLAGMNHLAIENEENLEVAVNEDPNNIINESLNNRITNDSTSRIGIGFLHSKKLSSTLFINGGVRYEDSKRKYDAFTRGEEKSSQEANFTRNDSSTNASLGFISKQSDNITFSGNVYYSERIPETSELYSSGAHHATESFELGNPNLKNEESVGIEFSVSGNNGQFNQKLSVFYNEYDNFIYQSDTGFVTGSDKWNIAEDSNVADALLAVQVDANENIVKNINGDPIPAPVTLTAGRDFVKAPFEELSIREYIGVEAETFGFEYEFNYAFDSDKFISGFVDSITGKNKSNDTFLPRIPPYRIGLSYHKNIDDLKLCLNAVHYGKQDKVENPSDDHQITEAYTIVDARMGYEFSNSELYLKVNNVTDRIAFVHTSFLKGSSPLPGRSVEIGYNLKF